MAYDQSYLTGPVELGGGAGLRLWAYTTTDNLATVEGAGYIADATDRGMEVGDVIMVTVVTTLPNTTPIGVSLFLVDSISSGAATIDNTAVV